MGSETWRGGAGLALALLLGGCGSVSLDGLVDGSATPGSRPRRAAPAQPLDTSPLAPAGLTALPSARQVSQAVPVGRPDPFLPLLSRTPAGAATPGQPTAPLGLPEGFSFQGVILAGGVPQALVQFGSESGTLKRGDRGGVSNTLLPPGWSVASIDVGKGRLILQQGGQRLSVDL